MLSADELIVILEEAGWKLTYPAMRPFIFPVMVKAGVTEMVYAFVTSTKDSQDTQLFYCPVTATREAILSALKSKVDPPPESEATNG